ncbi:MAG: hypothetical protein V4759_03630 [Pseudomonadota bacterium]
MTTAPRPKPRGSRRTLTHANLVALGAERLADLALELAEEQPVVKRRLRLELAAAAGPDVLAGEIDKALTTLASRRGRVPWRKYKALVLDLDLQRRLIAGQLAKESPALAFDLLGRFLAIAEDVLDRVNDARGEVAEVFAAAARDLGDLTPSAGVPPPALAQFALKALTDLEPRLAVAVLAGVIQGLDPAAVTWLRQAVAELDPRGPSARTHLRLASQMLADAAGDVAGYAATLSPRETATPWGAAQIGSRLLTAGRPEEALAVLEAGAPSNVALEPPFGKGLPPLLRLPGGPEWMAAYEAGLEATGRKDDAQALRWAAFETALSAPHLRAYLKRLSDFDDVVAEDRALALAIDFPDATQALDFLTVWPAVNLAAQLVFARSATLDGGRVEAMERAAQALEARHPLAATLVRRAIIEAAVRSRPAEWRDLVKHQAAANESLESQIADWGEVDPPGRFRERVRRMV